MRHALVERRAQNGRPTGVLSGTLNTLWHIVERFDPDQIVMAWDGTEPSWRFSIYPEYKSGRRAMMQKQSEYEEQLYQEFTDIQLPDTMCALSGLGIIQIRGRRLEADDIIGCIAQEKPNDSTKYIVVSTDKDMLQLVHGNGSGDMRVWNPQTDSIYYANEIGNLMENDGDGRHKAVCPSPSTYLLWRTIIGDPSDSINGVYGVGEKTVADMLRERWALKDPLLDYLGRCNLKGRKGQAILSNVPIILRNLRIMQLGRAIAGERITREDRAFVAGCSGELGNRTDGIVTAYPKFLKVGSSEKNPMPPIVSFFARRGFDFAYWNQDWEEVVQRYRVLFHRMNKLRTQRRWNVSTKGIGYGV